MFYKLKGGTNMLSLSKIQKMFETLGLGTEEERSLYFGLSELGRNFNYIIGEKHSQITSSNEIEEKSDHGKLA